MCVCGVGFCPTIRVKEEEEEEEDPTHPAGGAQCCET
jgi:hypothetical protein